MADADIPSPAIKRGSRRLSGSSVSSMSSLSSMGKLKNMQHPMVRPYDIVVYVVHVYVYVCMYVMI